MLGNLLQKSAIAAPLRLPVFRRSWAASILSNTGMNILSVGAGWAMTLMTNEAEKVALVQTAMMLPVTLLALPAGAIADMFERRIVGFTAMSVAMITALVLTICTFLHLLTPFLLLGFVFLIACGTAVFNPAWQASVNEQVPHDQLPAAVSLNAISFNSARILGPAVGGLIVAAASSAVAFIITVVGYIPMLTVLYGWPRVTRTSKLPPEGLGRAVISGVRYVIHSPQITVLLVRTFLMAFAASSIPALMPLVARHQLNGDARTFGAVLMAFGIGAIISSFIVPWVRRTFDHELAVRTCLIIYGLGAAVVAVSHFGILTGVALVGCGSSWMIVSVLFNVGVQLSSPRWVSARVLASFQATITGGMGFGSWTWGLAAQNTTLQTALLLSAGMTLLTAALGLWLPMPRVEGSHRDMVTNHAEPEINLPVAGRSGPVVLEIEYRVPAPDARAFYYTMMDVQLSRQRNGAYGWSIARDVANAEVWIERLHYPTWHDYLRQGDRITVPDRELEKRAHAFHRGPEPVRVRRVLERPFGATPDPAPDLKPDEVTPVPGSPAGGA